MPNRKSAMIFHWEVMEATSIQIIFGQLVMREVS